VKLYLAGWKSVSLIDVKGKATFTVWLCGCNLRCPFCHNWRLADRHEPPCHWVGVERVLWELGHAARLVDYLHVTGGEPLIQADALRELFRGSPVPCSLNSNLTMPGRLRILVGLIEHAATDLKVPWRVMTGGASERLWRNWLESLEILAREKITVELRIPVPRNIHGYLEALKKALSEASRRLRNTTWYIVVNPLLGPPHTDPRDREWCRRHCSPGRELVNEVAGLAKRYAKTYVNAIEPYRASGRPVEAASAL